MNRFSEMVEAVFAAAAFAEHGEWDEAVRIAEGSLRQEAVVEKRLQDKRSAGKQPPSSRPRARL